MDAGVKPGAPRVHSGADADAVADLAARFMADAILRSVSARGECRVALAGGSTPRAAYERLARRDLASTLDWSKVRVFFGDERMVPPDDPASNYRMAKEALLDRVALPPENVHRIQGELGAERAAAAYGAALGDAPLDVVLLGMGEDGHVASLFPGSPALDSDRKVLAAVAPVAPHGRVTLGFSSLDAAGIVALLVTGKAKASRVAQAMGECARSAPVLPAARAAARSSGADWFLDDAAASGVVPMESERPRRAGEEPVP